jgi:hypothetical protein
MILLILKFLTAAIEMFNTSVKLASKVKGTRKSQGGYRPVQSRDRETEYDSDDRDDEDRDDGGIFELLDRDD